MSSRFLWKLGTTASSEWLRDVIMRLPAQGKFWNTLTIPKERLNRYDVEPFLSKVEILVNTVNWLQRIRKLFCDHIRWEPKIWIWVTVFCVSTYTGIQEAAYPWKRTEGKAGLKATLPQLVHVCWKTLSLPGASGTLSLEFPDIEGFSFSVWEWKAWVSAFNFLRL